MIINNKLNDKDIESLKKAEEIANKYYDGHYCLFKFTTNYRFVFDTPVELDPMFAERFCKGFSLNEAITNATDKSKTYIAEMEQELQKKKDEIDFKNDLDELIENDPNAAAFESVKILNQFKRDYSLICRKKASYKNCQICGFTFKKKNGDSYNEIHHVIPLSKNGKDAEINTLVLCANCHRQMHYASVDISRFFDGVITINGVDKKIRLGVD